MLDAIERGRRFLVHRHGRDVCVMAPPPVRGRRATECLELLPARRARREEFVEALVSTLPVVEVTLAIIRIFAEVDANLRATGTRLPTSDLLIACTALSRDDEIVTGNPRHFRQVPGLVVHDWSDRPGA